MRRFLSFRDFDWTLLGIVLVLCTISVLEIYSATLHTKYIGFHTKQMYWIAGGLVAMFVFAKIDYHKLIDFVPWAYGVCLVALVAVLAVGQKVLGARRWIKLGPMHFQPSEWVKLVLILAVARYFANLGGRSLTWKDIFKAFALVGVPMLLVLKQPDLGTTLTYLPILVAGLFLGGINVRQALILGTCGLALVAGVWTSGKLLKPYQKARLTSFINPDNDPKGTGYQLLQSKIAVGSGGVWGKGAAKGTQTQGDFLPIPHADFIFAAFGEEHGFVGAFFVLLLYFFVLMRLIQNAQTAADLSGSLIIMGVVAVLTFQIAVNVGMVIGFMPVAGIPLPLMSYGGVFGVVYVPGAGCGYECPHASVRQLRVSEPCGTSLVSEFNLLRPPELSGPQETKFKHLAGQVRMDLEPGRIGFMSTQRRENRWQRTSCTKSARASGHANPAPIALHCRALATVGTAPPAISAWLATNSLQSDHSYLNFVTLAWFVSQDIRRSSPPPGAGIRAATGTRTTRRSFLPFIPSPAGFTGFHPTLPQFPVGDRRWTERYDGKRDLHLQHAA